MVDGVSSPWSGEKKEEAGKAYFYLKNSWSHGVKT